MANSPDYFRAREAHCRTMAESAKDPMVKRIHTDFADRYAQQAADAEIATDRAEDGSQLATGSGHR